MLLKRFFEISYQEKGLFTEAFVLLCIVRIGVLFLPFKTLALKMGEHMKESSFVNHTDKSLILAISKAINRSSRYTPCRSLCMEQALAASLMLKRRNLSSTIYFGVTKNNSTIKAHAWLRSGDIILTGARGRNKFTVVSYFGRG